MKAVSFKTLVAATLLALCMACGTAKITEDLSLPAIQADYPTAEFSACGSLWHGAGVCRILPGQPVDTVSLQVQGYYSGTIRVYSTSNDDDCEYDDTVTYQDNALVTFSLPARPQTACTIGITVSPDYPDEQNQPVVIHSFRGYLRIRVVDQASDFSASEPYLPNGSPLSIQVPASDTSAQRVVVLGCGVKFDSTVTPSSGNFSIPVSTSGFQSIPQNCIIEGVVMSTKQKVFTSFVSVYETKSSDGMFFSPLATPSITYDTSNKSIVVLGDPSVAAVSLDSVYSVSNQMSSDFDQTLPHVLRLLTTAGRSVVGTYNPTTKAWSWL